MWHFISEQISNKVNQTFICETAKLAHQQHQHSCYVLKGSKKRYFVKLRETSSHSPTPQYLPSPLQSEADGLAAIKSTSSINSPQVICQGVFEENHKHIEYLVIQYICFKPPSEFLWQMAGQDLAAMHKYSTEELLEDPACLFGWSQQNWIGSTVQTNHCSSDWAIFYCEQRLLPLIEKLQEKRITIRLPDTFLVQIHDYLSQNTPIPSLLHGDLWNGNIGFTANTPVVFDPAVYIGDREVDLAMALLFGGFAKSFFDAYQNTYPLADDSQLRIALYQLYPVLNHALMFGGSYLAQADQLIDKVTHDIASCN